MYNSQIAAAFLLIAAMSFSAGAIAQESHEMPLGALMCSNVEDVAEHAAIVRAPSSEGIRPFVEARTADGSCRVVAEALAVSVIGVDKRGFARVDTNGEEWWTDAENIWGYFDAPNKVKTFKTR